MLHDIYTRLGLADAMPCAPVHVVGAQDIDINQL